MFFIGLMVQSYEKSREKQRNSFLFLPKRRYFTIGKAKVTKNGRNEKGIFPFQ